VDQLIGPARLERPVVRTIARAAATLVCALAAVATSGCFDVRLVDPGPVVIDDFDDGNLASALPNFDAWDSYSFNPNDQDSHERGLVAETNSPFALYLDFSVDDPPDGEQQNGGAALISKSEVPWDVTSYRALVFSAKLESGTPPIPTNALLYVELGCKTAVAEDGSRPGIFYVVASVNHTSTWREHRIEIHNFNTPSWDGTWVAGGPAQCLRRIDSIRFSVDAYLRDGESGRGVLTIDNIYVE
jgi:hypothetical protein